MKDLLNSPFVPLGSDNSEFCIEESLQDYLMYNFCYSELDEKSKTILFPLHDTFTYHFRNKSESTKKFSNMLEGYICNTKLFSEIAKEEARIHQLLDTHLHKRSEYGLNKSRLLFNKKKNEPFKKKERINLFQQILDTVFDCMKQETKTTNSANIIKAYKNYKNYLLENFLNPTRDYRNKLAHASIRGEVAIPDTCHKLTEELFNEMNAFVLDIFESAFQKYFSEIYYMTLVGTDKHDIFSSLKTSIGPIKENYSLEHRLKKHKIVYPQSNKIFVKELKEIENLYQKLFDALQS